MLSILTVAGGAAIGALVRYGLARILPLTPATFATNILSCIILGAFAGWFAKQKDPKMSLELLFATGICGGMGTFSTWMMDILNRFRNGDTILGMLIMILPVLCGLGALMIGFALSSRS